MSELLNIMLKVLAIKAAELAVEEAEQLTKWIRDYFEG